MVTAIITINGIKYVNITQDEIDAIEKLITMPLIWHDNSRGVQLFIPYENNAMLMQGEYGLYLLDYFKNIIPPAPTFNEPEGVYIYLCELYLEHRTILERYGTRIAFATEELKQKSEISINNNITDAVIVS